MSLPVNTLNRLYHNAVKLIERKDYESALTFIEDGLKHADDTLDDNGTPFLDKFRSLQQQMQNSQGAVSLLPEPFDSISLTEDDETEDNHLQGKSPMLLVQSDTALTQDSFDIASEGQSPDQVVDQLLQQAEQTEDLTERRVLLLQAQQIEGASADSLNRALELYEAVERSRIQAESAANLIEYQKAKHAGKWRQAIDIAKQSQSLDGDWDDLLNEAQNNFVQVENLQKRWQSLSEQAASPSISVLQAILQSAENLITEAHSLNQAKWAAEWQTIQHSWQQRLTEQQVLRDQFYTAAQQGDSTALAELAKFDPDAAQSIQDELARSAELLIQSRATRADALRIVGKEPYAVQTQLREILKRLQSVPSTEQINDEITEINSLLEKTRAALSQKSISQTLGETLSEFDTPETLLAVIQPLQNEIEKLEESEKLEDTELAKVNQAYYDSTLLAFQRVATTRLRSYIATYARPLFEKPPFDFNQSLEIYRVGIAQWQKFQAIYLSQDGNLKRRLEIITKQASDLSDALSAAESLNQRWQLLIAQAVWDGAELLKMMQEELQPAFEALSPNARYILRFLVAEFHVIWSKRIKQAALHLSQEIKRLWVETEDKRGKGAAHEGLTLANEALSLAQKIKELQTAFTTWQQIFAQAYQSESVGETAFVEMYEVGDWHIVAPIDDAQQKFQQMQFETTGQSIYEDAMHKLQEGQLASGAALLKQIPPNTFYTITAKSLLDLLPNLEAWQQNAIESENHRDYSSALTNYQKIVTQFPAAKFATERVKALQPLAKQWQDTQTWLKSAKAAIERDDFANALGLLKNIPDEFQQEQEVQETRQRAEAGHRETERIKNLKANIRQLWQGSLSQEDYDQIGELLKGLPQSDSAYTNWYQRWQRAAQVFEQVENREQPDQQLVTLLENLPAADSTSDYAQKLLTQIKQRITERQDSAGIQQQLEQAAANNQFTDVLYIAKKIIDAPKKYAKLQEGAKTKRADAEQKLRQQISDILDLPPTARDSQLNFVRLAYKALVDVLGQTLPGLTDLGEQIHKVEKIAEITRLLNDTETDNSEIALNRIRDFRQQFGSNAELDELQARSELRRFNEIAKQASINSEMQKAVENFDKAISAYRRISRPSDYEKNLFKSLQDTRGRVRRSAIFEFVREKWNYGDFTAVREALTELPENDAEAQRYVDENNKLETLTLAARNATEKECLPNWRKVLAQKPELEFAKEQHGFARDNLLVKAQELVKRFVGLPVNKLVVPDDIYDLVQAGEYAQLVLEDAGIEQPEAQQIKNQTNDMIKAWQRYLSDQKNQAEQEGVDWESEQFERLARNFELAIQSGWFSERERRTVTDLYTKAEQVRNLKKSIEQARQHYENTLTSGTGDFQDALTAINKAAQEPFFGLRKETVVLRRQIEAARAEVQRLRNNYAEYNRNRTAIVQQQPTEPFDDQTLRQIYESTRTNLQTALDAVRTIRTLDPENQYNLREREWLKRSEPDPFIAKEAELLAWQNNLESIRTGLEEIKKKVVRAGTLKESTNSQATQRTSVDKLRSEAESWKKYKTILQDIKQQIAILLALPADIPALRRYQARLKDIEEKSDLESEIKNAEQLAETLTNKAELCETYLSEAAIQYANSNWQGALSYYSLVQGENPQDSQAAIRINDIKGKLKNEDEKRRNLILVIVATVVILVLLGIGFSFGCPNGSCLAALQSAPTATPTRQLVTRIPSSTPTPIDTTTPQPSAPPTAVATTFISPTPTNTLPPVYARCRMNLGVTAYPKDKPGKGNPGNGSKITESMEIVFLDYQLIDEDMWYQVAYATAPNIPLGWISLKAAPCTSIPNP